MHRPPAAVPDEPSPTAAFASLPGALLDVSPDVCLVLDAAGRCVYANARAAALAGRPAAALAGASLAEALAGVHTPALDAAADDARRAGAAVRLERFAAADGRWLDVQLVPAAAGLVLFAHDITHVVLAEQWAHDRERVLERIATGEPLEHVIDALGLALERRLPGTVCALCLVVQPEAGAPYLRLLAAPSLPDDCRAEIDGQPIARALGPCAIAILDRATVAVDDVKSDAAGTTFGAAFLRHGLRSCLAAPVLHPHGRALASLTLFRRAAHAWTAAERRTVEEATHLVAVVLLRAEGEAALRDANARLDFALAAAHMGTWELELSTGLLTCSAAVAGMLHLPRDDGPVPVDHALAAVHPDDRERVRAAVGAAARGGADVAVEFRVPRASGAPAWLAKRGRVVRDGAGIPQRLVGIVMDVTDRKTSEHALAERETQLQQAQHLEAIGRLAGGIAHDFNNLLTVIRTSAELVADAVPAHAVLAADVREIVRAADRGAALTRQLLAFSRRQPLTPAALDLNDVVRAMSPMLERLLGEDVELALSLAAEPVCVLADRTQIEQVVMNLALNARDAMPQGGVVVLETGRDRLAPGEGEPARADAPRPGLARPAARLSVADTGDGIDPTIRARVFEPFFTTKPLGRGTGLGLATVHGIVSQSGGTVRLRSVPGRGTRFDVLVPWHDQPTDAVVADDARGAWREGSGTVLVVEDETGVRMTVRRVLERGGYAVLEARHGADALRLVRGAHVPDLVLTDVVMPEMGGGELAARLAREAPGLPVLFMSGYAGDELTAHGLPPDVAMVPKPFTADELLRAVALALRARPA